MAHTRSALTLAGALSVGILSVGVLAVGMLALGGPPAAAQYYDDDEDRYDDAAPYTNRDRGSYDGRDDDWQDYDRGAANDGYGPGEEPDDVTFFYEELSDHGRWISHRDYGYVWTPNGVDDDWRPYTRGTWARTDDYGWYWASDEPFGWATYHYGRWFHDERYGWLWVPGTTWGPAWVAWRYSDSYVGWAPLPPDAYWDRRQGLRYDAAIYESPRFSLYWSFVEPRYIASPRIYQYCAPRHRARTIIYSTRPQTRYDWRGDRIVNLGISFDFFSRHLSRPLPSVRIYATEGRYARGFDRRAGDTIRVWRPNFRREYHAGRKHNARSWGNGFWSNVDRRAAYRPQSADQPRGAPGRTWGPTWGLPPGRGTWSPRQGQGWGDDARAAPPATGRPAPPSTGARPGRDDRGGRDSDGSPGWNRDERGDRGDRGERGERSRGERPDGRPAWDGNRNRGRDDSANRAPTETAPPRESRPPAAVGPPAATPGPSARPPENRQRPDYGRGRGDRGDSGNGGRETLPNDGRPERTRPADARPTESRPADQAPRADRPARKSPPQEAKADAPPAAVPPPAAGPAPQPPRLGFPPGGVPGVGPNPGIRGQPYGNGNGRPPR